MKEDNRLIAEFMGYINNGDDEYLIHPDTSYDHSINSEDWFLYDTSWDWLIPVVEKIEQPDYNYFVHILGNGCFITTHLPEFYRDGNSDIVESIIVEHSKLQATYEAVVEFIKYYNALSI